MIEIDDDEKEIIRQTAIQILNRAWLTQIGNTPADLDAVFTAAACDFEDWLKDSDISTSARAGIQTAFNKQIGHQLIINFSQSEHATAFKYNGENLLPIDRELQIDEMFDRIGDGLYGDLFSIEKDISLSSIEIATSDNDERITFDLERFGKRLQCIVSMGTNSYEVTINGKDYGAIEINEEEAWVQKSGVSMPQDLVDVIGAVIERHYS